jgi:hypothetical protein
MGWWLAAVVLAEIYGSPEASSFARQSCRLPGALNHYFPARTFDSEIPARLQRAITGNPNAPARPVLGFPEARAYSKELAALKERSLSCGSGDTAYRLLWLRNKRSPISVRIEEKGSKRILSLAEMRSSREERTVRRRERVLSPVEWRRIEAALESSAFWTMAPKLDELSYDADDWIIEGRKETRYHAVSRLAPPRDEAALAIGTAILEAAGLSERYVE